MQPYAHKHKSVCPTLNHPPGYTIWVMLKDILLSFVLLCFGKGGKGNELPCAIMEEVRDEPIIPLRWPRQKVQSSFSDTSSSCTISSRIEEKLLSDAALPSGGEATFNLPSRALPSFLSLLSPD